jgi:hypothetical protein
MVFSSTGSMRSKAEALAFGVFVVVAGAGTLWLVERRQLREPVETGSQCLH